MQNTKNFIFRLIFSPIYLNKGPLHWACYYNSKIALELLKNQNIDVNKAINVNTKSNQKNSFTYFMFYFLSYFLFNYRDG